MESTVEPVRSFGEALDVRRAAARSWAAIKAAPLILWVGGLYRACTNGGGGGGGGSSQEQSALLDGGGLDALGAHGPAGLGLDPAAVAAAPPWAAAGPAAPGLRLPVRPALAALDAWDAGTIALIAVFGLALLALAFAFTAWLLPGWHRVQAALFRTGRSEWGTLFTSFDAFPASLGYVVIKAGLLVAWVVVVVLPFLAWDYVAGPELTAGRIAFGVAWSLPWLAVLAYGWLGICLADRIIALEGVGAWEGFRISWRLMDGQRLPLLLFLVLVGLLSLLFFIAGALAFCVGLVVTVPLAHAFADLCLTEAYLHLTRPPEETESWAIRA